MSLRQLFVSQTLFLSCRRFFVFPKCGNVRFSKRRRHFLSWQCHVSMRNYQRHARKLCEDMSKLKLIDRFFSLWSEIFETKVPVRVLNFAKSVDMNLRTRMFRAWQSSILRQNKVLLLSIIMKWQQFILGNKLEKLRQSSRYADLLR